MSKDTVPSKTIDILVIGNGFDLAHGLKTSYKDFLNYCGFGLNEKTFRNNIWLNYFLSGCEHLGNTWIDLETEIYNFLCKVFDNPVLHTVVKLSDMSDITFREDGCVAFYHSRFAPPQLFRSNAEFVQFLYKHLRDFTKEFESYLLNEVLTKVSDQSQYKLSLQAAGILPASQNVHVLNFNYTDTCERLYKHKFNTYCQLELNPIYIHGKAIIESDCKLVFGTHSFDRQHQDKDLPIDLNIFQKHNQRHRYENIEAYQNFLRMIIKSPKDIIPVFHVIGHSLDRTDHNILKHIFKAREDSVIKIYYHNEDAQQKLINNITRIIGEEDVMAKVLLIHQHDAKRGLLIPTQKVLSTCS